MLRRLRLLSNNEERACVSVLTSGVKSFTKFLYSETCQPVVQRPLSCIYDVFGHFRMSFDNAGFSVSGKVDGSYESNDVSNSYNSKKNQLIRPNIRSDDITQILHDLELLAEGKPSTETFQSIKATAQRVLSGDQQDPIKAVIVPLEDVNVVHSLFVDSPGYEVDCSSLSIMNGELHLISECFVISGHCQIHGISE